jgi:hypothetical protein
MTSESEFWVEISTICLGHRSTSEKGTQMIYSGDYSKESAVELAKKQFDFKSGLG